MPYFRRFIFFVLILPLFFTLSAQASDWPKIEGSLSLWDGPKLVTLRTNIAEPLTAPAVQELLELLLERGFVVIPANPNAVVKEGLILDHRLEDKGTVLALSRAADQAIIAFERRIAVTPATSSNPSQTSPALHTAAAVPAPVKIAAPLVAEPPVQPVSQAVTPPPTPMPATATEKPNRLILPPVKTDVTVLSPSDAEAAGLPKGPVEIAGAPAALVILDAPTPEQLELVVQDGSALKRLRLSKDGLAESERIEAPLSPLRPLHLDLADLENDGKPEIIGNWAQDHRGIYQGTESHLHTWIFGVNDAGLSLRGKDLGSYVRAVQNRAFTQNRGAYDPFVGPVFPLVITADNTFIPDKEPCPWGGGSLYDISPFSANEALGWDEARRMHVVDRVSGKAVPGTTLLADLGEFRGPEIAIPLETPEYRSGFSKEDQVRERNFPLPRRVSFGTDGAAYTIERKRSSGLPLLGKPNGQDAVVRIVRDRQGLHLERPFAGVEAFIIDFALVERSGKDLAVLLLLNEQENGSGRAWLQLVQ